jgi:K+ transporter
MLSIQVRIVIVAFIARLLTFFVHGQISFTILVYPSLVLAYLGQGSRLIVDGQNVIANVFYLTIPGKHNGPLFWILYVYAILATLIASQAMITASFSLVQQLVNMRSLPQYAHVLSSGVRFRRLLTGIVSACIWFTRQTKIRANSISPSSIGSVSLGFFKQKR